MPHRAAKCLAEEKHSPRTGRPCVWFTCNPLKTACTWDTLNTNHSVVFGLKDQQLHIEVPLVTSSHRFCVSSTPSWLVAAERFGVVFWSKNHPLGTLECVDEVYRGVVLVAWFIRSSRAEIKPWLVSYVFTHLRNFDYRKELTSTLHLCTKWFLKN